MLLMLLMLLLNLKHRHRPPRPPATGHRHTACMDRYLLPSHRIFHL